MRLLFFITIFFFTSPAFGQQIFTHGKVGIPSIDIFYQKVEIDSNLKLVYLGTSDTGLFLGTNAAGNVILRRGGSGGAGVSQIYNYYGTIIHGGDSIEVDTPKLTTTYQNTLNEKLANKVTTLSSPNNTTYPTTALLNTEVSICLTATADSVSGRVKYIDSLTRLYVTGYQDDTAKRAIRSAIPTVSGTTNKIPVFTGANSIGNSNIFDSTSLGHSGVTDSFTFYSYVFLKNTPAAVLADSVLVKGGAKGTIRVAGPPTGTYPIVYAWPSNNASLATTGTAGTYGSATACPVFSTDAWGRVYSVANTTITPAFASLTGTPTTAGGYGITDVYTKTASDARYAQTITLNTTGVLYTSPVTFANNGSGSYTASLTLASQSANTFLAGPTSGGSAIPSVRSLVAADIPDLSATYTPLSTGNSQTGTTYTLVAGDKGKVVSFNNSSAITLTIPASLGSTFYCTIQQNGTGQITFTASSTTLHVYNSYTKTAGQYAEVSIIFTPTADTYILQGLMQ